MKHRLLESNPDVGGSPAPAAPAPASGTPSPAPASGSAERGRAEIPDFGDLATSSEDLEVLDDSDSGGTGASPVAPVETKPAAGPTPPPVAPVPPAAAAPAAAPVPPDPAPAPQPKAGDPPPVQQAAPPAAPAPGNKPQTLEEHRAAALPELAKYYALTPEEAETLRVEPEKALPLLAAKLHYEVLMANHNAIVQMMPQLIESQMSAQLENTRRNDAFFSEFSALKDPKHLELVRNSIKAFKSANPTATEEQIRRGSGALALITLGLPVPGMGQVAVPAAAPAAVQAPATPRPAGAGGAGAAPPSSARGPANEIEELSNLFAEGQLD